MSNPLEQFKDSLATTLYGMTRRDAWEKGICINCKKVPVFHTAAGRHEYRVSALCEPCFDKIKEDLE